MNKERGIGTGVATVMGLKILADVLGSPPPVDAAPLNTPPSPEGQTSGMIAPQNFSLLNTENTNGLLALQLNKNYTTLLDSMRTVSTTPVIGDIIGLKSLFTTAAVGIDGVFAPPLDGQVPEPAPTYVDLPSGAHETYAGSGIYTDPRPADFVSNLDFDINLIMQNNYAQYGITPESTPGLKLKTLFIKAPNGQFVEVNIHERAVYTGFQNVATPQILSTLLYEGKFQINETTFATLPESTKQAFANLPLAGEGSAQTPTVGIMADLMKTNADASWTEANQLLDADGQLANFDIKAHFPTMSAAQLAQYTLGEVDPATGHKIPDVINIGLQKMFGNQVIENAGLPKGPAVWINAKIGGVMTPVLFQQFERMSITVNPNNYDTDKAGINIGTTVNSDMKDQSNNTVVQVGLQGQIVMNGLLAVELPPTVTPTAIATATSPAVETSTPAPGEHMINTKYGEMPITQNDYLDASVIDQDIMTQMFNAALDKAGMGGKITSVEFMPNGDDLEQAEYNYQDPTVFDFNMGAGPNGDPMYTWFVKRNTNDNKLQVQFNTRNDNLAALHAAYTDSRFVDGQGGLQVGVAVLKSLLVALNNSHDLSKTRGLIGDNLFNQIYATLKDGKYEYDGRIPFKLTLKNP